MTEPEHALLVALTCMTVHRYGTKGPHHDFVSSGEAAFEQMIHYGLMKREGHSFEWTDAGKEFVTVDCDYDSFVREGWPAPRRPTSF